MGGYKETRDRGGGGDEKRDKEMSEEGKKFISIITHETKYNSNRQQRVIGTDSVYSCWAKSAMIYLTSRIIFDSYTSDFFWKWFDQISPLQ